MADLDALALLTLGLFAFIVGIVGGMVGARWRNFELEGEVDALVRRMDRLKNDTNSQTGREKKEAVESEAMLALQEVAPLLQSGQMPDKAQLAQLAAKYPNLAKKLFQQTLGGM